MILKKSYLHLCQIAVNTAIRKLLCICSIINIMLNRIFNNVLYYKDVVFFNTKVAIDLLLAT